eukprot:4846506-Pleurochrysis_carterae.AAC.1
MRSSSRPLPLQASEYDRRAAVQVMVCRMRVIILRSVASINSGATTYLLASSAVRGGRPELETEVADATGAAVVDAAGVAVDCDWERVWRVVACRLGGISEAPWAANTGFRGEGGSNVLAINRRERQWRACSRLKVATLPCGVST